MRNPTQNTAGTGFFEHNFLVGNFGVEVDSQHNLILHYQNKNRNKNIIKVKQYWAEFVYFSIKLFRNHFIHIFGAFLAFISTFLNSKLITHSF